MNIREELFKDLSVKEIYDLLRLFGIIETIHPINREIDYLSLESKVTLHSKIESI